MESKDTTQIILTILMSIGEMFVSRNRTDAIKVSAGLTFWEDGMLRPLRQIASGDTSSRAFDHLKHGLGSTDDEISKLVHSLSAIRSKVAEEPGGAEIARLIDEICYGPVGKMGIRADILDLIDSAGQPDTTERAKRILNAIEAFDGEIRKLHRAVTAR